MIYTNTYGQTHGQFSSPDFPKPYDPGIHCVIYTFTAQRDEIVELTLNTIQLAPTQT